jgi:hypothetical protein
LFALEKRRAQQFAVRLLCWQSQEFARLVWS